MDETRWTDARTNPPPTGKMVRVIYDDGLECNAKRAGGPLYLFYLPKCSNFYRYVDVAKWREIGGGE